MRPRPTIVALALVGLLLAACGNEAEPAASPSTPTSPSQASPSMSTTTPTPSPSPSPSDELGPDIAAYLALCSVAASVADEDLTQAEATFHDEVHDPLHDLTDRVEEVDRTLSAALLQTKSTVEADFAEDPPDAVALSEDLADLLTALEDGLAALGIEAPACPEPSS